MEMGSGSQQSLKCKALHLRLKRSKQNSTGSGTFGSHSYRLTEIVSGKPTFLRLVGAKIFR